MSTRAALKQQRVRYFLAWLEKLKLFPFSASDSLMIQKEARKSHAENWYFHIDKCQYQRSSTQVPQSESPCGPLVIVICQMFEMLLDFVYHMSCVLRCWLCVCSWDATPKPCHILGLGENEGCQELKRDDEWVCESEWGEKEAFQRLFFCCVCVFSCVRTCDQECIYVWEEGILPAVFFPEPLPVSPPHNNSQSRRRRVWPRRDPTHQRRRRRGASVSLSPPSSVCFHHSLNVTINPVHTQTFPHLSIQCVLLVYLIWLGRSEPCICACQCGNVCVKSFGSFLNAALPKDPLGNVVLTPPLFSPLVSFLSPFHNYIASVSPCSAPSFFLIPPFSLSSFTFSSNSTCGFPLCFSF